MPVVNGLEEEFEGRIAFVTLDWDDSSLDELRGRLGITDRTQYVLVNAAGEAVKRWYGLLNEAQVAAELATLLKG